MNKTQQEVKRQQKEDIEAREINSELQELGMLSCVKETKIPKTSGNFFSLPDINN